MCQTADSGEALHLEEEGGHLTLRSLYQKACPDLSVGVLGLRCALCHLHTGEFFGLAVISFMMASIPTADCKPPLRRGHPNQSLLLQATL